jgi:hypothetical protein
MTSRTIELASQLRDLGTSNAYVIPNRSQAMGLELKTPEPEPESEQAAIKRIAIALVEGAIERHRFFGIPLPEADAVEEEMRAIRPQP